MNKRNSRPFLDKDEYFAAVADMRALLSGVEQLPITKENAADYGLENFPDERLIILDSTLQAQFSHLRDYDLRDYKLLNLGCAAISLRFSVQHRYQTIKAPKPGQVQALLLASQAAAVEREKAGDELQKVKIKQVQKVLNNFDRYSFLISNYEKFYMYGAVSFRYIDPTGRVRSKTTHLIKDQVKKRKKDLLDKEEIRERFNILFVDSERIKSRVKRADEKTVALLQSFEGRIDVGRSFIYFKKG